MSARLAGACGVAAFVSATVGWLAGGFAQPAAYSVARDDISDLGAVTAASPWLYNQVGANLTGLLVAVCALGLWSAVGPSVLGRLGSVALLAAGVGSFFDGLLRLDCRGIDAACTNHTWHAHAHKTESAVSAGLLLGTPFILALAFRRNPEWRGAWLPTLLAVPVSFLVGIAFSAVGSAAAQRATTWTWFVWLLFVGVRLLRASSRAGPEWDGQPSGEPGS